MRHRIGSVLRHKSRKAHPRPVVYSPPVMFCPECQAEYRPGFKTCSDCHVDLVESLPEPSDVPSNKLQDADLREVWVGQSQEQCVAYCAELREAKIPYHVIQHERQYFKDTEGNFRIGVLPEFLESAKKIINGDALDDSNDPDFNPEAELQPQDDKVPMGADDQHRDWKDEIPDDATIEVASEKDRNLAEMIVLALRENDIESRLAVLSDGSRKIFVAPEDESVAREIVREIDTDSPPE